MSGKETAGTVGVSEQELTKYFDQKKGPAGATAGVVSQIETKAEKKANDWASTRYQKEIADAIKQQEASQPKSETDVAAQEYYKKTNADAKKAEAAYLKYQKEMDTYRELKEIEESQLRAQERVAFSSPVGSIRRPDQFDIPKGLSIEQAKQKKILEASLSNKLFPIVKEMVSKNDLTLKEYNAFLNKRGLDFYNTLEITPEQRKEYEKKYKGDYTAFAKLNNEDGEAGKFARAKKRLEKPYRDWETDRKSVV